MQGTEGVTEAWCLAEHSSFSGGDSGVHEQDVEIQNIFLRSMSFIDEGTVYGFDRARSGATPVYYSPDRSSVLKLSRSASTERLSKMEQAKALCQEMNLTHITIPSACAYKEFLVEQCVPLAKDISSPAQIRLYLLNKEKFAEAARELARLFCYVRIGDLVDDDNKVKYDNIPLYIDPITGEGKVALIDLEEFRLESNTRSLSAFELFTGEEEEEEDSMFPAFLKGCFVSEPQKFSPKFPVDPVIFQLFPDHFNEIMEELEKIHSDIENYRDSFQSICDSTLSYFEQYHGISEFKPWES